MPGHTKAHDKDIQRAQAKLMLAKRITGSSLVEIGRQFNAHPDTVARRIKQALREGLLDDATETVVKDLVPMAVAVFRQALKEGDVDVARDILFGTGILSKNPKPDETSVTATAELTLDQWRAMFEANQQADRLVMEADADPDSALKFPNHLQDDGGSPTTPRAALGEAHVEDGLPEDE